MHNHSTASPAFVVVLLGVAAGFVALCSVLSAFRNSRRRPWPVYRVVLWISGLIAFLAAVAGPIAEASREDFAAHMIAHILLGMVAPLLLVLAAPMTLALRALDVVPARRLSAILRSRLIRFFTQPVTAAVMNVGGLWLLYTTAFRAMHENVLLLVLIQVHVFVAGYLFTASMISVDPLPHRAGYFHRAVVLVIALAGHDILAKYLYAHPPDGVPAGQAELGSMVMYYAGDAVDLVVIILLCYRWFAATRPRPAPADQAGGPRPTVGLSAAEFSGREPLPD